MSPWTCSNIKCGYDKELTVGQHCPLCGTIAKEYDFTELDSLWKQKWDFKKSVERAKKRERVLARMKFCPKCGSSNINFLAFYCPSIWKCLNCDYEGALVVEDSKLAEIIEERYQKRRASRASNNNV